MIDRASHTELCRSYPLLIRQTAPPLSCILRLWMVLLEPETESTGDSSMTEPESDQSDGRTKENKGGLSKTKDMHKRGDDDDNSSNNK